MQIIEGQYGETVIILKDKKEREIVTGFLRFGVTKGPKGLKAKNMISLLVWRLMGEIA